jgi:ferric-dicitrate binding protein FerR (iron transport regulator)
MSSDAEPRDPQLDPRLASALDGLPVPRAREEFRAKMRQDFLSAPFEALTEEEADDLDSEPEIHVDEPLRPDFSFERLRKPVAAVAAAAPSRRPWSVVAAVLTVAAAILILWLWPSENGWRVAPSSNFVKVRVDGDEFLPGAGARLAASLAVGSRIEVEGGSLQLVLDQRFALSLSAGAAMQLVAIPPPAVRDDVILRQELGSLAIATGPGFTGSTLRVITTEAIVNVTGTQFVVDVYPGMGTCVCCCEGSVEVNRQPGSAEAVAALLVPNGQMGFLYSDGRESSTGAVIQGHLTPIEALRQVWRSKP